MSTQNVVDPDADFVRPKATSGLSRMKKPPTSPGEVRVKGGEPPDTKTRPTFEAHRDPVADTEINADNLQLEYLSMPGVFRYYAQQRAASKREAARAKLELRRVTAETATNTRRQFAMTGEKATEGRVSEAVECDLAVIAAEEAYIEAQYNNDIMSAVLAAMEIKSNMLMQLGADRRAERGIPMRTTQLEED